jgi:hypothetical protein
MDYSVITAVSKGFKANAATLKAIGKALEVAIQILQAMAFVSLGTTKALAQYLSVIKEKVQKLGKICEEFAGDLANAIRDHKKGDIEGKRYFGEGI